MAYMNEMHLWFLKYRRFLLVCVLFHGGFRGNESAPVETQTTENMRNVLDHEIARIKEGLQNIFDIDNKQISEQLRGFLDFNRTTILKEVMVILGSNVDQFSEDLKDLPQSNYTHFIDQLKDILYANYIDFLGELMMKVRNLNNTKFSKSSITDLSSNNTRFKEESEYNRMLSFLEMLIVVFDSYNAFFTENLKRILNSNDRRFTMKELKEILCSKDSQVSAAHRKYLFIACDIIDDDEVRKLDRNADSDRVTLHDHYALTSEKKRASHDLSADSTLSQTRGTGRKCACGKVFPTPRIIGGIPARPGEFPWIVMLLRNQELVCAAIIVDERHGITAAHCFDVYVYGDSDRIIAGKFSVRGNSREDGVQEVGLKNFVIHQEYNRLMFANDIAVIEFTEALRWSDTVMPACLPSPGDVMGTYCTVAGWGDMDARSEVRIMADVLMKVDLRTYSKEACQATFQDTSSDPYIRNLPRGIFCAANGVFGQKDACQVDSGGPLMCAQHIGYTNYGYVVYGLVSNGNGCAVPGEPGFYTDVRLYTSWIERTIRHMH